MLDQLFFSQSPGNSHLEESREFPAKGQFPGLPEEKGHRIRECFLNADASSLLSFPGSFLDACLPLVTMLMWETSGSGSNSPFLWKNEAGHRRATLSRQL